MDVDDAASIRLEEWLCVNAIVARVDDELHAMRLEEVTHGGVAFLFGGELLQRKLPQRDVALARECRTAARLSVRRHRHDIESAIDEVAKIRSLS